MAELIAMDIILTNKAPFNKNQNQENEKVIIYSIQRFSLEWSGWLTFFRALYSSSLPNEPISFLSSSNSWIPEIWISFETFFNLEVGVSLLKKTELAVSIEFTAKEENFIRLYLKGLSYEKIGKQMGGIRRNAVLKHLNSVLNKIGRDPRIKAREQVRRYVEANLKKLIPRQHKAKFSFPAGKKRAALYWYCKDLSYPEIAERMGEEYSIVYSLLEDVTKRIKKDPTIDPTLIARERAKEFARKYAKRLWPGQEPPVV